MENVSLDLDDKAGVAIALATGRKLLVLDEATSNLDVETETLIAARLRELVAEKKITILSVSHRANFHAHCTHVYQL